MRKMFLFCLVLALAGCSGPALNPGTGPIAAGSTSVPTLVPEPATGAPTDAAQGGQPDDSPLSITNLSGTPFSDDKLGFSFKYPETWTIMDRAPDAPPGVTLRSPSLGQGTEPIIFAITIDVQPAKGQSVKGIVDQQLAQVPKDQQGGINRQQIQVGGAPAEEVIGLPSQNGALETFVINADQVHVIILQPYDRNNPVLKPYLDEGRNAYGLILNTWKWTR